jgi:hypothetical protein
MSILIIYTAKIWTYVIEMLQKELPLQCLFKDTSIMSLIGFSQGRKDCFGKQHSEDRRNNG